jgi:hypothetical protein
VGTFVVQPVISSAVMSVPLLAEPTRPFVIEYAIIPSLLPPPAGATQRLSTVGTPLMLILPAEK